MTERRSLTLLIYMLIGMASLFIIIWGIQSMAFIINPILLAMVITISLLPLVTWLRARGVPGWLSLVMTILVVVAVLAVVLGLVFFSVAQLGAELATPPLAESSSDASVMDAAADSSGLSIESLIQLMDQRGRQEAISNILSTFVVVGAQAVASAGVALIIFVFMLASAVSLPQRMRSGFSIDSSVLDRVNQLTSDVQRYVSVMTVINFLVGLGNTIMLWIIGVDYAVLWGVLAWVMGYVPTIGFWIALIPPVLLAWATLGTQEAIIVFAGYVLINGSVQNLVQPRMMGQSLQISPLIVLISLFFWGGLLGAVGAVLSVPLTLIVLTVLDSFDATRWLVRMARFQDQDETSQAERQAGMERVRSWWGSARHFVTGNPDSDAAASK